MEVKNNIRITRKCAVLRRGFALFLAASMLAGCAARNAKALDGGGAVDETGYGNSGESPAIKAEFELDPETFSLKLRSGEGEISVSLPQKPRRVEGLVDEGETVSFRYPDDRISAQVAAQEDYVSVIIASDTQEDNSFTWPAVQEALYYLPMGEGKRIPKNDEVWREFLGGRDLDVMEQLSMPFWAAAEGDLAYVCIMETPYRSRLQFTGEGELSFNLSHEYPAIDEKKENTFRIYLTENDPVSVAKIYRGYVMEKGRFTTLQQKAEKAPDIEKLYGAPHIYLWGDRLISPEDVDWPAFRKSLDSPVFRHVRELTRGTDEGMNEEVWVQIAGQDYVDNYQKNEICRMISAAMWRSDFYRADVLTGWDGAMEELIAKGAEHLSDPERITLHRHALAATLPQVFQPADSWIAGDTTELIENLKAGGIDRAWIGLGDWRQGYAKPELVERAVEAGYLIGPYDSYHSIHEPGKEQWITAAFEDGSLYEDAAVTGRDGEKITGFQGVGRKLNSTLSLPAVRGRVDKILSSGVPFNSWFIDCDATGEIYDDYSLEHMTTMQQDEKARLDRMSYIRDEKGMVIGSEGGNDYAAQTIAFAHGIELPSFSWMDPDMGKHKDSQYYMGRYYSARGGVPDRYAVQIPVKEEYYRVFLDPRYQIPLYKLVYNDSVITGYHWDWSTFKIEGRVEERMLREILFNIPPLYHLDGEQWQKYGKAVSAHTKVWSEFSKKAVRREMTDFRRLTEDGLVQSAGYGEDLTVTANFGSQPYVCEGRTIPGMSLLILDGGQELIYTPKG